MSTSALKMVSVRRRAFARRPTVRNKALLLAALQAFDSQLKQQASKGLAEPVGGLAAEVTTAQQALAGAVCGRSACDERGRRAQAERTAGMVSLNPGAGGGL